MALTGSEIEPLSVQRVRDSFSLINFTDIDQYCWPDISINDVLSVRIVIGFAANNENPITQCLGFCIAIPRHEKR